MQGTTQNGAPYLPLYAATPAPTVAVPYLAAGKAPPGPAPYLPPPAPINVMRNDPLLVPEPDPTARLFDFCFPENPTSVWYCPSYLIDYVLVLLFGIAAIIMFVVWDPTDRAYQLSARDAAGNFVFNDNTYTYPILDNTFEEYVTALISIVAPVVLVILYTLFRCLIPPRVRTFHDIHHFLLGMGTAVALAFFTFFFINRGVGGLRPDFAARLETGDADLIEEGRESFPSGHTTGAFVGLVFFALWASGKLRVFHSSRGNLWRFALAVMAPLALAIAQAITRITDNRHSPIDVVTGALLGSVAAACGYYLHYPSLHAPDCDLPKNRRRAYLAHLFSGIPTPLPT